MTIRAVLFSAVVMVAGAARAEDFTTIPPPALDQVNLDQLQSAGPTETVVLAGGCFWGVQGVFQHVKGVTGAVSGYAGGAQRTAEYDQVTGGDTGHAESVQVTYDPKQISLGRLLQIYFSVAHDPTQLNRQGPDRGTQYRSAIFPANDQQAAIAKAYIAQLNLAHVYKAPVATTIEPGKTFYPAEAYHQDYLTLHPTDGYIAYNDIPKVEALARRYPGIYRTEPVLVNGALLNKQREPQN